MTPTPLRRQRADRLMRGICALAVVLALLPLGWILAYVVFRGLGVLSWSFLTQLPTPSGTSGGGIGHAIVGSLLLLACAAALGVPVGLLAGTYLAAFGNNRFGTAVRFCADTLSGVPSIVLGLCIYLLVVVPMHGFSLVAGGVALGLIMLPTVTRTTEELLRLVPRPLWEAALALGVPKWRASLHVVLATAAPGIATAIMLAVARVAGETAPLLFTALSSHFWPDGMGSPTASLPVQIYTYALAPYADWHAQAWGAALILILLVLTLNLLARAIVARREQGA